MCHCAALNWLCACCSYSLVVALATIAEITSSHLGWPALDGKFFLLVRVPRMYHCSRSLFLTAALLSPLCIMCMASTTWLTERPASKYLINQDYGEGITCRALALLLAGSECTAGLRWHRWLSETLKLHRKPSPPPPAAAAECKLVASGCEGAAGGVAVRCLANVLCLGGA